MYIIYVIDLHSYNLQLGDMTNTLPYIYIEYICIYIIAIYL